MNAIDLLKNDHDYVDQLFGRIEETPPSRHAAIFKQIKNELDTHAHIEEKIFYPECRQEGDKELQDVTMEAVEEHAQMKKFLREIARSTSTEKREAKLKVLIEDTRHHVKEEESEMFPLVEDQFSSDRLEALGERMEAEKAKFQKAKRIPKCRQQPAGALTKVVEKAKAVVASMVSDGSSEKKNGNANGKRKAANGKAAARSTSSVKRSNSSKGRSSRPSSSR